MESKIVKQLKIYVGVILLQFGFAGFAIVAKFALNKGTSHYTFSVYRNAIAAVVFAPFAFVLESPIIGQNLFYAGMTYTSATFTAAMCNVLPALTFLMAWILRVERVNVKKLHSQAKIMGTLVTVSGAMIMTLIRGSEIGLPWTKDQQNNNNNNNAHSNGGQQSPIKGALMIGAANIGYSLFYILQGVLVRTGEAVRGVLAITLKSYPAGLSLTSLICMIGALQGAALTLVVERGNTAIWSIGWDAKFLAYAYGGIISSGITYYLSGVIMKEKGPVFVTSFNPLNMVIVAVLSSFIFAEKLDVGKIAGSMVIIVGLYLVIWGKSKDTTSDADAGLKSIQKQHTTIEGHVKSTDKDVSQTIPDNNIV
ncbi:hypothetical protein RD792_004029 [Penstemon davidsonii]|uniref:WAT1-related protein n=1 Tax=Penstemon davidsonii TaxID=160366 RepID=A0ABR0DGG5_9LAMI|nr:hypothetical protein RD792_004029 [Penstemon davidsonii]